MIKINDTKLMNEYIEKFKLNDTFATFHKLKKELVQYEKDEFIFMGGDEFTQFLFCVHGRLEIYNLSASGNNFTLAYCDPLCLLGDIEFLAGSTIPNNVQALTKVICISVPIEVNKDLLENDITLYKYLAKRVVNTATLTLNDSISYQNIPTIERIKHYLKIISHDNIIDKNLNEIARTLRISYRQLMRHLSTLTNEGYIVKGEKRGTYKLNNSK